MKHENDTGTETNFGWWIDKPERADRYVSQARRRSAAREERAFIWRNALMFVALMVAFSWSVKSFIVG